jgi:hypothetical protein
MQKPIFGEVESLGLAGTRYDTIECVPSSLCCCLFTSDNFAFRFNIRIGGDKIEA